MPKEVTLGPATPWRPHISPKGKVENRGEAESKLRTAGPHRPHEFPASSLESQSRNREIRITFSESHCESRTKHNVIGPNRVLESLRIGIAPPNRKRVLQALRIASRPQVEYVQYFIIKQIWRAHFRGTPALCAHPARGRWRYPLGHTHMIWHSKHCAAKHSF